MFGSVGSVSGIIGFAEVVLAPKADAAGVPKAEVEEPKADEEGEEAKAEEEGVEPNEREPNEEVPVFEAVAKELGPKADAPKVEAPKAANGSLAVPAVFVNEKAEEAGEEETVWVEEEEEDAREVENKFWEEVGEAKEEEKAVAVVVVEEPKEKGVEVEGREEVKEEEKVEAGDAEGAPASRSILTTSKLYTMIACGGIPRSGLPVAPYAKRGSIVNLALEPSIIEVMAISHPARASCLPSVRS